ncbi:AI-2E family transporter [Phenylobacterium soli]|uniref:AI-2E family transporter n=1 Tax=Phenylobacterium soli TaxID=2170551 RepID=A0A328AJH4_9CAUL|nr:AI-2E family transporter [Phenylobacterium soli]RAK55022.1 AI-2E family transporter [Phenylobacterium soli]
MPSPKPAAKSASTSSGDLKLFLQKLLITVAVAGAALIAVRWLPVFLLAFGAALIAVMLRSLANPIRKRTPLDAAWSLAVAVFIVLAVIGLVGWFVGAQIAAQFDQLEQMLPKAWLGAQAELSSYSAGRWLLGKLQEASADHSVSSSLGMVAGRLGRATRMSVGVIADLVVVIIAGIYFAAQPSLYREGLLRLVPEGGRTKVADAVEEAAASMRKWLAGTGIAMLAMGIIVAAGTAMLGLPAPLALGLLAGLAEFVPIVGAIVSAVPGLLLAGPEGPHVVLYTLVFYVAAHQFEGHVLIPLIQRHVVSTPPALTLFSVLAFGLLFGPLGVILATPLAVVLLVLVRRLYLNEDVEVGR